MAEFLSDTFTEASTVDLNTHSPGTGGSWSRHANFSSNAINVSGGNGYAIGASSSATGIYTNAATPGSADYYVEAVVTSTAGSSTGKFPGVMGRASNSVSTFYQVFFNDGVNGWQLNKTVSGTGTDLGSAYSDSTFDSTNGTTRTIRLDMSGSTIRMLIDGVERASVTDTDITSAGIAGVRTRSGAYIESVTAVDSTSGSSIATISNFYRMMRSA